MKKCFLILFWLNLFDKVTWGQETVSSLLNKSRAYYNNHPFTKSLIYHEYKPSIAETTLLDTFSITTCRNVLIQHSKSVEKLIYGDRYIFMDHKTREYTDFSPFPTFKEAVKESLDIYPFVNVAFLDIKEEEYKLRMDSSQFIVFNFYHTFYFNKSDFSLNRYRYTNLSEYGLEIKSYRIASTEDASCNESPDLSFLKTYKHRKVFRKKVKVGKMEGKPAGEIIPIQYMHEMYNSDTESKWVLLDFFYQTCYPCILAFKNMQEKGLDTMKSRLKIIGVDYVESDLPTLDKFMKRYKLDFPLITGRAAKDLVSIFNPNGIAPLYVLLSPDRRIMRVVEGFDEQFFDRLLKWIK